MTHLKKYFFLILFSISFFSFERSLPKDGADITRARLESTLNYFNAEIKELIEKKQDYKTAIKRFSLHNANETNQGLFLVCYEHCREKSTNPYISVEEVAKNANLLFLEIRKKYNLHNFCLKYSIKNPQSEKMVNIWNTFWRTTNLNILDTLQPSNPVKRIYQETGDQIKEIKKDSRK